MRVVCIKIPPTIIKLKLKVGDISDTHIRNIENKEYLFTVDCIGNTIPCDALDEQYYFITIEKFREIKFKELGI